MNQNSLFYFTENFTLVDMQEEIYFFPIVNDIIQVASVFCIKSLSGQEIIRSINVNSTLKSIIENQYLKFKADYNIVQEDTQNFLNELEKRGIIYCDRKDK